MKNRDADGDGTALKKHTNAREEYIRASLALILIPSVGSGRMRKLFETFPNPMSVFKAGLADLAAVESVGAMVARAIKNFRNWDDVDRMLMMTKTHRMSILTPFDSCYPQRLLHIYDPPALIWVKGDPDALKNEFLAVVGTRRPSRQGREATIRITLDLLGKLKTCIVSGLAHGVDALAHSIALDKKRCTVAVLASGLDRIYPTGNRRLAYDIINSGGALISEYPPGTKPEPHHFPVRNRIVSGMSVGVLVTETGVKGGSVITVNSALDQGREVFAVPHDIGNERGDGCNLIIQRGWGKLVRNGEDIAEELPAFLCNNSETELTSTTGRSLQSLKENGNNARKLSKTEETIVGFLAGKSVHIDDLSKKIRTGSHLLLPVLLQLELDGFIIQKPGKKFALCEW